MQKPGSFATYHEWLTTDNFNRWSQRTPRLNNAFVDCTFAYNNYRVIYNGQARYAGSPWHRGQMDSSPTGAKRVDFDFHSRKDDLLLGETDFIFANPGNPDASTFSDASLQSEQTSYLIFKGIGMPYNYRRYIHLFMNGNQRSRYDTDAANVDRLMEDAQQPNGTVVSEWYPDSPNNEFFKIEDWFEFPDNGFDFTANNDADITRRTVTYNNQTSLTAAPYRYMFRHRSVGTGHSASDYSQFFRLVDAASPQANPNVTPVDVSAVQAVANVEEWMRIFACQHTVGNWDSYGYRRGKNSYMYLNGDGRYEILTWDIDFTVGLGGDGTTQSFITYSTAPDVNVCTDPRIIAMWDAPAIRRMYFRAFKDIIDGPLNASYLNPILDAKAAAFTLNNITYDAGQLNTIKSYITGRNSYIAGQINAAVTAPFAVSGASSFSVTNNLVTLTGTAPVMVKDIVINGQVYPIQWSGVAATPTTWTLQVAVQSGVNNLTIQGYDLHGQLIAGDSETVSIVYNGEDQLPENNIVISEIMYNPATPQTSFVEIHNHSDNFSFDLTGWKLNGVDFTFPGGTILTNGGYLVVCKNRAALLATFDNDIPVAGEFNGDLDNGGETLTLIKPGVTPDEDVTVCQVKYDDAAPWPPEPDGLGPSLQLIDAKQDIRRVSNWSGGGGWSHYTYPAQTLGGSASLIRIWLNVPGDVYIDNVALIAQTGAHAGSNYIRNGSFEQLGDWSTYGTHSDSVISTDQSLDGTHSMHVISTGSGGTAGYIFQSSIVGLENSPEVLYSLSFDYLPTPTADARMGFRITSPFRAEDIVVQVLLGTPGRANTTANTLPAYDPLWLNEVQPDNQTGIADGQGEHDPWIELYNAGTEALDLSGYYLADNYNNLTQWPFPAGASIAPGEYQIVWADGQPGQTVGTTELHTSFRLPASTGSVALVRIVGGEPQITDYLDYSGIEPNLAYGDYPNGQPVRRLTLYQVTPRAANSARPAELFINEWLASNTGFNFDPADNATDDWFELYNPTPFNVDLAGYYLTDTTNNKVKFRIPNGYFVPANGFLLIWADEDSNQNTTNSPDLHVNFKLSASGEQIALYSSSGELVDLVDFDAQANNVSEGRFADGAAAPFVFMQTPTPKAPNVLSAANTPPTLDPIPNQTITLGQTVSVTATATDAEAPPQTLSFTLDPVVPAGASIDPLSGLFTWTPDAAATTSITVRVTDSGTPLESATQNFTVIVVPPPEVTAVLMGGGQLQLGFPAVQGKYYRIEYTASLADPIQWTPLPGADPIQATGDTLTLNETISGQTGRFYRVVALE